MNPVAPLLLLLPSCATEGEEIHDGAPETNEDRLQEEASFLQSTIAFPERDTSLLAN